MTTPKRRTVLVVHPGAELFGSDRMLRESVVGFLERGARVVVALPGHGPLVADLTAAGAEVVITPLLVLRKTLLTPQGLPRLFRDAFRGLGSTWRLISRVRPDAVYVSTIVVPQWPLIARMRRVRSFTHIHEAEASGNQLVSAALYSPHLAVTGVIVNSAFTMQTVRRRLPALARRAEIVPNGIASPDTVAPPRAHLDGPLHVLYVGRLSPRKGPDLVIDAAAGLAATGRPVRVTLLGAVFEGYEWFEEQLRASAASAGIEVDFAGFHSDVWPFLASSDVLVVPSLVDESFGNTAVEGILALRPVITSDSTGLQEAVDGYTSATVVPAGDAAAITRALAAVADDWPRLVAAVDGDREEALRRHAPARYRAAIADLVLGPQNRTAGSSEQI